MKTFTFKQFQIRQDKIGMKLSTDAVLLGSWTNAEKPIKILDIGTGTGILALMMAQKFPEASITAVEIENTAYNEADFNIKNSNWHNRIKLLNTDFLEFATINTEKFDLIITNPPYYENHLASPNKQKQIAHHADTLPLEALIKNVSQIISPNGTFALIAPNFNFTNINLLCNRNQLFVTHKTLVFSTEIKQPQRILLQFSTNPAFCQSSELIIRNGNSYTVDFLELTKDFYLFA